jgi:hypothetical protein
MARHTLSLYGPLLAALLAGCVVTPAYGPDYAVAPALPFVVELGVEPYYVHDGFFYYYHERDHRWSYSRDRAGPWKDLPRDRYPREIRYHDRDSYRDRGEREHEHRD